MEIWKQGNMEIQKKEIQKHLNMEIWKQGKFEIGKKGKTEIWIYGYREL